MSNSDVDVVVIGGGFSGLFATWKLSHQGLKVRAFDMSKHLGGVWSWNTYPGAQTDSPHETYRFTFDPDFLAEWRYSRKFPPGHEVLQHLNAAADRFNLREKYTLETKVTSAVFDEDTATWVVTTDKGEQVRSRYVVTGLGLVSAPNLPSYPGDDSFAGEKLLTSLWPREGADLRGKRIALIGTGSSGVQIAPILAAQASALTVYQRTPNYISPTGNKELASEDQEVLRPENYGEVARKVAVQPGAFPFELSQGRLALEATPEERERVFEEKWEKGGFSLLYESFDDVATDPVANEYLAEFFRKKIREIVKDPETAASLSPDYPYGSKRPPTSDGFYKAFNEDHVDLVDLRKTPILEVTERGIRTEAGEKEFDIIVYATGFDALTGAYTRMDIVGRDGVVLRDYWLEGPRTYLGTSVHGFPNFFMIAGPQSPFANLPPGAEVAGGWVSDAIGYLRENGLAAMEPSKEAEDGWIDLVESIGASSFSLRASKEANSWFTGSNIEGKAEKFGIFFGGAGDYNARLHEEAAAGFPGFDKRE
ncbi:NAD(P)/FAD-dependent oxidoreductase [Leucobacter weissii]|uniref:NAD(P)/FAD-dependent oxidoreductase n=1 Tax=Leucobacter weissii TaxID=1983706 RepID=A0A939MIM2_9MICO|nr:NAD(P)/FAD-dependent oxidoreductase [Leucobacter weissii]MBO1901418.1 NAD(P)/FAD-dependent oxidoreductase [Leucobacter weissii]